VKVPNPPPAKLEPRRQSPRPPPSLPFSSSTPPVWTLPSLPPRSRPYLFSSTALISPPSLRAKHGPLTSAFLPLLSSHTPWSNCPFFSSSSAGAFHFFPERSGVDLPSGERDFSPPPLYRKVRNYVFLGGGPPPFLSSPQEKVTEPPSPSLPPCFKTNIWLPFPFFFGNKNKFPPYRNREIACLFLLFAGKSLFKAVCNFPLLQRTKTLSPLNGRESSKVFSSFFPRTG